MNTSYKNNEAPTVAVLDIDMTLINTISCDSKKPDESYFKVYNECRSIRSLLYTFRIEDEDDGSSAFFWGLKRPYLREFLTYVQKNYDYVIVWTAATKDYAHALMNEILKDIPLKPQLIWSREECNQVLWNGELVYTKPLSKLSHRLGISMKNAVLIDDQPYSHIANNPKSKILIPQYRPTIKKPITNDTCFLQLIEWMRNGNRNNDIIFEEEWVSVKPPTRSPCDENRGIVSAYYTSTSALYA